MKHQKSKRDPMEMLVSLIKWIGMIIGYGVVAAIGGIAGGGSTIIFTVILGNWLLASIPAAVLAGLACHRLYVAVNRGPLPPLRKYIGASIAYAISPVIAALIATKLQADLGAVLRAILVILLSGGLPFVFLTILDKLGLFVMPSAYEKPPES